MSDIPQTLVQEEQVPLEDTLQLSISDDVQAVMSKGLYDQADQTVVVILDEAGEVAAITTAGKLRGEMLPRTWRGALGRNLMRLSPPPEVLADTPIASLDYLVQEAEDTEWLLVVDAENNPVGALSCRVVRTEYLPPFEATGEITLRGGPARLWGAPLVKHTYWYCPVEDRIYLPHAIRPDAEGRMRDRKGHLVERRAPEQV